MNAEAGFFQSKARVSIFFFFSSGGITGSASSSDFGSPPKLPVSYGDSAFSSSDSSFGVGSFFVFLVLILRCEEGLELVVFGVSESLPVFVFAAAIGTSIFANSATSSLTSRCESEVFTSSSGFSFYGVSFGGGSEGQLDSACDTENSFCIFLRVVSILCPKLTRMLMTFGNDNYSLVLM